MGYVLTGLLGLLFAVFEVMIRLEERSDPLPGLLIGGAAIVLVVVGMVVHVVRVTREDRRVSR